MLSQILVPITYDGTCTYQHQQMAVSGGVAVLCHPLIKHPVKNGSLQAYGWWQKANLINEDTSGLNVIMTLQHKDSSALFANTSSSHGTQAHKELPKLTCKRRANSANSIQNGVEELSRHGSVGVRIPGIQTRLCRVVGPVTRVKMPRGTKSKLTRALRIYKTMTSVARPL